MNIATYTFQCRFNTPAFLPVFKGSTLRGAFGHALKRIACALRQQECDKCLLFSSCAYAFLFEVEKTTSIDSERSRMVHRPHPYVLVPPDETKRLYETDDSFSFDIILFGPANQYLPHVFYAVQEIGKSGLGKKTRAPGCFRIETVQHDGNTIFSGADLQVRHSLKQIAVQDHAIKPFDRLSLSISTPLRLKHLNRLQSVLPFHLLARSVLRRISTLEAAYGNGEPDLDYRGMVKRAHSVEIVRSNCRWVDTKRYSNRQHSTMKFGGIQGDILYQGSAVAEILPLLKYCEQTHLGKQTSFGLGRISAQKA